MSSRTQTLRGLAAETKARAARLDREHDNCGDVAELATLTVMLSDAVKMLADECDSLALTCNDRVVKP